MLLRCILLFRDYCLQWNARTVFWVIAPNVLNVPSLLLGSIWSVRTSLWEGHYSDPEKGGITELTRGRMLIIWGGEGFLLFSHNFHIFCLWEPLALLFFFFIRELLVPFLFLGCLWIIFLTLESFWFHFFVGGSLWFHIFLGDSPNCLFIHFYLSFFFFLIFTTPPQRWLTSSPYVDNYTRFWGETKQ